MPRLRVGTSGYHYPHWRGVFYPPHLSVEEWFSYYAARFDTVEINNTFYQLPDAKTFDAWRERAPAGFCYALKLSRYATHVKRLKEPRDPLRRFLTRARRLEGYLGPILVQVPPRFRVNPARLAEFLEATPRSERWAVEFRDPSWLCEEVYVLLRAHGAALCIHDLIENHPWELTARWTYLRFHGGDYSGCYSSRDLAAAARRVENCMSDGLDVFVYFNNDVGGYAVVNAAELLERVTGGNPLRS